MSAVNARVLDSILTSRQRPGAIVRNRRRNLPECAYIIRLAWPVEAWRALAPLSTDDGLDLLQRAVLKLAQAGVVGAPQVGRHLGVHADLAAHVQHTCFDQGLIDGRGLPTEAGQKAIADSCRIDPPQVGAVGWIFRCRLSGDVLPLFHPGSLPGVGVSQVDQIVPLPVMPALTRTPSDRELHEAIAQIRRIRNFESAEDRPGVSPDEFDPGDVDDVELQDWDDAEDNDVPTPQSPDIRRVVLVSEVPEFLDLEVLFYITPDTPETWSVTAPQFQPGTSPGGFWYFNKLSWACDQNLLLREQLTKWRSDAAELFIPSHRQSSKEESLATPFPMLDEDGDGSETSSKAVKSEWDRAADNNLTSDPSANLRFHGHLAHVDVLWEQCRSAYRIMREDPTFLDILLTRLQKALEAALVGLVKEVHDREFLARDLSQPGFGHRVAQMAYDLGVDMPVAMRHDGFADKMMRVARLRSGALRDRAVFLLADAYSDARAPFAKALASEPRLLCHLDMIADLRNKHGAHYSENEVVIAPMEILEMGQSAFDAAHYALLALTVACADDN